MSSKMLLSINGQSHTVDVEPDTPLLWVLRDELHLNGTKYSCGIGLCGACTVLIDGAPMRSCLLPVSTVGSKAVQTIEGLKTRDGLHKVQQAWIDADVPQCGYCQSGQILSAVALLNKHPHPSDEQIDQSMTNICRCGTYPELRKAIHLAAGMKEGSK
jgi:aerobic-type carbon monoxide dehydrogenase small subunit (CoxS/CutS family)